MDKGASAGCEGRRTIMAATLCSRKKFAGLDLEAMSAIMVVVRVARLGQVEVVDKVSTTEDVQPELLGKGCPTR